MNEVAIRNHCQTLATILPASCGVTPDQIATAAAVALTTGGGAELLRRASPESLMTALTQCAQLGLLPDGKQCALVPFKGQAGLIVCYAGKVLLGLRSGAIESCAAHVVCEGDEFDVQLGTDPRIYHKPKLDGTRGKMTSAYAVAVMKGGEKVFRWCPMAEIERAKKKSQQPGKAWTTDFEAMAMKTAVHRLFAMIPTVGAVAMGAGFEHESEADSVDVEAEEVKPRQRPRSIDDPPPASAPVQWPKSVAGEGGDEQSGIFARLESVAMRPAKEGGGVLVVMGIGGERYLSKSEAVGKWAEAHKGRAVRVGYYIHLGPDGTEYRKVATLRLDEEGAGE